MWAGLGIVLIALVGWFWFRQTLDVPALIGLALIVGGVFLVNAFSIAPALSRSQLPIGFSRP